MQLADSDIDWHARMERIIEPYSKDQLQPATYDLLLGDELLAFLPSQQPLDPYLSLKEHEDYYRFRISSLPEQQYQLLPNQFLLATTVERVNLPGKLAGRLEGKSSLGRLGLIVHSTAGFIDPGFVGQITLEMTNISNRPIVLRTNMRIAQLSLVQLSRNPTRTYGHPSLNSHYQNQAGTQPSRGAT